MTPAQRRVLEDIRDSGSFAAILERCVVNGQRIDDDIVRSLLRDGYMKIEYHLTNEGRKALEQQT